APTAAADDWPHWMGPNRDAVWAETGLLDRLPPEGPKVLWRTPVGVGYAGPAVVGNRVFVADYLTQDDVKKDSTGGLADFKRAAPPGAERVLCLRADPGDLLWKPESPCKYAIASPAGPRCTPTVLGGKVYALGAMGNLLCLDAEKGTVLWSKDFPKDYGV